MSQSFKVNEFASLAGVTVRTLHHYDRLGLLKPKRTNAGYRLYFLRDLERLEQIVALKFLGIPLRQIKVLLDRESRKLPDALRSQRKALEEKRRLLDRAIDAIRDAENGARSGKRPDSAALKKIIEVIGMQNDTEWMKKYYTGAAVAKMEERKQLWSPERQEQWSKEWSDLFRDVEAALDQDPAGPTAQALAARWTELVEAFTNRDPDLTASVAKLYADRPNWPAHFQRQMAPFSNKKVLEFIHKAIALRNS